MSGSLSYDKVVRHINKLSLSEEITKRLIRKARSIPHGALPHFVQNINTHIANTNKEIVKEANESTMENNPQSIEKVENPLEEHNNEQT